MITDIAPGMCVSMTESVFFLQKGELVHAGKRTVIGIVLKGKAGWYQVQVLKSDGPNALPRGLVINRPAGNLLQSSLCNAEAYKADAGLLVMAGGGHLEGYENGLKVISADATKGGIGIGASHAQNGIKGAIGTEKRPIEFEGNEIVLTKKVSDNPEQYEFEGQKMTGRQIASKINSDNGGVTFADGGEITSCRISGRSYNCGGETMSDHDVLKKIGACECDHPAAIQ